MKKQWIGFDIALRGRLSSAIILGNQRRRNTMSMHSSLKGAAKIRTKRNVLKRFERIELLKKDGKWKDGDRAFNLPKTKSEA